MSLPDNSPATRPRRKKKSIASFRRALAYFKPHWRLVIISIACAFLVGLTFTGGLGAMLPVIRVLFSGDTVQNWVDRRIAARRLYVELVDQIDLVKVVRANAGSALHDDDQILLNNNGAPGSIDQTLHTLAEPHLKAASLIIVGGPRAGQAVAVPLPPLPWHLSAGHAIASSFPTNPVAAIAVVLGILMALAVVGNFVRYFQEHYSDKAAILAVNDIRRQFYDHVLHMRMEYFGVRGTSDLTSRLVQDAQGLQDGFKTVLGQSIQEPIKAAMAFALALWFDWHLTLIIVLFAPIMGALIQKFGKKMRRASRSALQSSAVMLGQLESTMIGIRVVKASQAERFERRRYRRIMGTLVDEQMRMSRIDAISAPILETLTLLVVCSIVLIAAYLVRVQHTLDATTFMGLMACLMAIGESLRRTSKVNNALQKSNAAAARIFETLDEPMERRRSVFNNGAVKMPARSLISLPPIAREIRFENITFTYPNAPQPALQNVNLAVPRGQSVAIVGRNGSGKTTLLALLPRFYDPQQGRILIDGLDVKEATMGSVRKQIGIVTQEAVIFPGIIADNIAYGRPSATRPEIEAAAKRAFAHDFIMEKANGYDTALGEHGAQLSGGQRQRICIARAILRQTPILILDEATSQVDAESEHLIQQAIETLMHERTTFVIAHRFSTILSADTIVVMDRGQIVAQGKHEELLSTSMVYQQLYDRQLLTTSR